MIHFIEADLDAGLDVELLVREVEARLYAEVLMDAFEVISPSVFEAPVIYPVDGFVSPPFV